MKALMQNAIIKHITVHNIFELSPNIVQVLLSPPPMQLFVSKLNLEISYWLYLSGCLSSMRYHP